MAAIETEDVTMNWWVMVMESRRRSHKIKRNYWLTPTKFGLSDTKAYSFSFTTTLGGGSSSKTSTNGQQHIVNQARYDTGNSNDCKASVIWIRELGMQMMQGLGIGDQRSHDQTDDTVPGQKSPRFPTFVRPNAFYTYICNHRHQCVTQSFRPNII